MESSYERVEYSVDGLASDAMSIGAGGGKKEKVKSGCGCTLHYPVSSYFLVVEIKHGL
jgi:hypothetical protein